jgi:hypothetical protein
MSFCLSLSCYVDENYHVLLISEQAAQSSVDGLGPSVSGVRSIRASVIYSWFSLSHFLLDMGRERLRQVLAPR